MGKLDGKTALITGGTSGIGLATAKRFVSEGAHVFITGRRQAELVAAEEEVGRNITGVQGDVSRLDDLDRLFSQIRRDKGRLDIVFANAGLGKAGAIAEVTEEDFDLTFNVNVKGTLFTVQKALPLMSDGSSIVLISSIAGVKGLPRQCVYSASKAAIRSLARSWTMDLRDRHIRVNVVSPGPIDTPGIKDFIGGSTPEGEQALQMIRNAVPMARLGMPDEVAKTVLFLASDDSSYVTGVELFVDGGMAQV